MYSWFPVYTDMDSSQRFIYILEWKGSMYIKFKEQDKKWHRNNFEFGCGKRMTQWKLRILIRKFDIDVVMDTNMKDNSYVYEKGGKSRQFRRLRLLN